MITKTDLENTIKDFQKKVKELEEALEKKDADLEAFTQFTDSSTRFISMFRDPTSRRFYIGAWKSKMNGNFQTIIESDNVVVRTNQADAVHAFRKLIAKHYKVAL